MDLNVLAHHKQVALAALDLIDNPIALKIYLDEVVHTSEYVSERAVEEISAHESRKISDARREFYNIPPWE